MLKFVRMTDVFGGVIRPPDTFLGRRKSALSLSERTCEVILCLETATLPDSTMADNVTNELLLEQLKAIRSEMSVMREDVAGIKADLHGFKSHMAGFMQSELAQDSAITSIKDRLARIERRLDIVD